MLSNRQVRIFRMRQIIIMFVIIANESAWMKLIAFLHKMNYYHTQLHNTRRIPMKMYKTEVELSQRNAIQSEQNDYWFFLLFFRLFESENNFDWTCATHNLATNYYGKIYYFISFDSHAIETKTELHKINPNLSFICNSRQRQNWAQLHFRLSQDYAPVQ